MHLSIFQRTRIIDLYLYYKNGSNVCDIIKTVAKERFNIEISRWGVRDKVERLLALFKTDRETINTNYSSPMKACLL